MGVKNTSLEAINQMSRKQLKQAILDSFEHAREVGSIDRLAVLQEAQFYAQELDRRHDSWITIRDFVLEIAVIALIGWEIHMSYRAERLQRDNFADEKKVFENLQQSSAATAGSLVSVNGSLESMNQKLQTELGLNYAVTVEVTFDNVRKWVNVANHGRTNVYVWGDRIDSGQRTIDTKGRMISPGGFYYLVADGLFDELAAKVPKGSERIVPFDVYLKNETGEQFIVQCQFHARWEGGAMNIRTQTMSISHTRWSSK